MKRVLCILSSMNAGGAETFLMKLYRNIDRERFQMDFCINGKEKQFYEDEIIGLGGKIFRIPSKSEDISGFKKALFAIVKDNGYECVLRVASNAMGFFDLKIAHDAGANVCACRSSNAGGDDTLKAKVAHIVGRVLYGKYVNRKIAPSDLAAIHTFGRQAYRRGEVFMLRNALDLDVYRFTLEGRIGVRKEFGIPVDAKVIGHVGRFQHQKNHEYLIKVFNELSNHMVNAFLLLVGRGELEDKIKRLVSAYGLNKKVIFAGVRKDIPQVLSAMDVLIMPSLYEGMPNVVVEAQAVGLPCVISDTITREANITGLVEYLPLRKDLKLWVESVMRAIEGGRHDARVVFDKNGYEIRQAASQFVDYLFATEQD